MARAIMPTPTHSHGIDERVLGVVRRFGVTFIRNNSNSNVKNEKQTSKLDDGAVRELEFLSRQDCVPIDEGSVRRVQVLDEPRAIPDEFGVPPRDAGGSAAAVRGEINIGDPAA